MNVFVLGLRVTAEAEVIEGTVNVLGESLPSSEKRVPTKVQLIQGKDHYVGKLLQGLTDAQTILAIGPTRPTPDGMLQMQPMLVVTNENFDDLLAVNLFIASQKVGKTSLLIAAIAAWNRGETFLGKQFHGECPPVLIVGSDQPQSDWGRMLQKVGLVSE